MILSAINCALKCIHVVFFFLIKNLYLFQFASVGFDCVLDTLIYGIKIPIRLVHATTQA